MERKTVIIATQVHLFIFPHSGLFVPATRADERYQFREHSLNHTQWLAVFMLRISALGRLPLHTCRDAHILVSMPTHVSTDASACFYSWLVTTAAANMGITYILVGWRFQPPQLFSRSGNGWTTRQFFSDTTCPSVVPRDCTNTHCHLLCGALSSVHLLPSTLYLLCLSVCLFYSIQVWRWS